MALLMVPLVKEYGLNYLFAATILTGIIQILFGVFKIARVMKFIPRAVMIGFVNALSHFDFYGSGASLYRNFEYDVCFCCCYIGHSICRT